MANYIVIKGNEYDALTKSPSVVKFTAKWCGPCKRIAPVFHDLASKYNTINFLEVDIDKQIEISERLSIQSIPCFYFYYDGNIISNFTIVGGDVLKLKDNLDKLIKDYINLNETSIDDVVNTPESSDGSEAPSDDLNDYGESISD